MYWEKKIICYFLLCLLVLSCNNKKSKSINKTELSAEEVYKQSSEKVVMILCYQDGVPYSQGSGFFVSPTTLVTNYHVVEGSDKIRIKFEGNDSVFQDVYLVKASPKYDIAILQTKKAYSFFNVDNGTNLSIGSHIYVIGNPRGLESTISDGILSGKRSNSGIEYLQITAPISPGNSGGPILDERGNVIGIATFTFKDGQNLNFGMPIKYLNKCVSLESISQSTKQNISRTDSTAISMVTYSKEYGDDFQQMSFKNNTNHTITSIEGVLIYRQNVVDYKWSSNNSGYEYFHSAIGDIFNYQIISTKVEIAPHLTKLVTLNVDPDMVPHSYCEKFCTGCGNTSNIHYHCEFRLLSYEIDE